MTSTKPELRQHLQARRDALGSAERSDASQRIAQQVITHPVFLRAETVFTYASMRREVDTALILGAALAAGKTVAVPVTHWGQRRLAAVWLRSPSELQPARFGVPEPPPDRQVELPPESLELVLVPGLAFDRCGVRLGYGAGLFDRFLATLEPSCARWGLAYELQLVDALPCEPHDQRLDAVVTEQRWLAVENARE
ncbi:MAG: 5-formyltetrahydrofolate cyclo-ligase [Fimbriimonadaceae bacterium]|nr:5-formyltetrahydrofolate cyclo-ligase [Fimbriimonadaceae bacterium]